MRRRHGGERRRSFSVENRVSVLYNQHEVALKLETLRGQMGRRKVSDVIRSVAELKARTPRLAMVGLAGTGVLGCTAIFFKDTYAREPVDPPAPIVRELPTDTPTSFTSNLFVPRPFADTLRPTLTPTQASQAASAASEEPTATAAAAEPAPTELPTDTLTPTTTYTPTLDTPTLTPTEPPTPTASVTPSPSETSTPQVEPSSTPTSSPTRKPTEVRPTLTLREQAQKVAEGLSIRFPQEERELIIQSIVNIAERAPRNLQLSDFDQEFQDYWQKRWLDRYPHATLQSILKRLPKDPLFPFRNKDPNNRIYYIGPLNKCAFTCWNLWLPGKEPNFIEIGPPDLHPTGWEGPKTAEIVRGCLKSG